MAQIWFTDAVVLLLPHCGNVKSPDRDGHISYYIAELYHNDDIKALLTKHGGRE